VAYLDFGLAVRGVETLLRHRHQVEEFTDASDCIFRIGLSRADRALILSDGTAVRPGDPVVHLHFWNEHLPRMSGAGPSAGWASLMKRRVLDSLATVARHLDGDGRFDGIAALHGATPFASRLGPTQMVRTAQRFGFDVIAADPDRELRRRIHGVLDSMMLWGMAYTFNRAALNGKGLLRHRHQLWISRARLRDYYGTARAH
jgi:hypothetical protein